MSWDYAADEIERQLKSSLLAAHASFAELQTCKRLLTQRRRYEAAFNAIVAESGNPSAENIAKRVKVDERTVRRWRHGGEAP